MTMTPQSPYLRLKLSLELFRKPPDALSDKESARLAEVAGRQSRIEALILGSPEAAGVVVSETTQAARLLEIRQRYPDHEAFLADLRRNGLNEARLEVAIARDLCIEAILERVAAQTPEASAAEAEMYYRQHPEAFTQPETRHMRHILMTFDDAAQKEAVRTRLEALRARIKNAEDFAAAALKHSQCPTALKEGVIGLVKRGQLFPELEAAAFALAEGELSLPLESPIGLHLLFCEAIHPETRLEFEAVRTRVIARLTEARRHASQQKWIKSRQGKANR
jgi:peptidylprolyl isomerase/peptidyl-prolyl cis-trans isomerase C